jgi:hypothetical protein
MNEDDSLNVAMFVGCAHGLITQDSSLERGEFWPYGRTSLPQPTEKELLTLSSQWQKWWIHLVEQRSLQIHEPVPKMIHRWFEPPEFPRLKMSELQSCCKQAWPHFHEWWSMSAGGKMALAWYAQNGNQIHNRIRTFEETKGRKVKPFRLYIDLVYTGNVDVIEVTPEYLILSKPVYLLKENWWMERFNQIG